jgi:uncharacterized membrane protein YhaH (DUF805 family)
MDWYIGVLKKYAVFNGRARRTEYWMFFLFNLLISMALAFADRAMGYKDGNGPIQGIYALAVFLPSIGVAIRRMHDSNHSGWWILLPLVNLIFLLLPGTPGSNRFGADPKSPALATPVGFDAAVGNPSAWSQAADPVGYQTPAIPTPPPAPAPAVPAGWYPDPAGRHQYRYWDGMQWTVSVSDNGVAASDPL